MKVRKKTFEIPIYFGKLRVIQAKNFSKWAGKLAGLDTEESEKYDALVCSYFAKDGSIRYAAIFRLKHCTNSTIAHEVVHLVNRILTDRGAKLDASNDEPQAYLTGWVTKKVYSVVRTTE